MADSGHSSAAASDVTVLLRAWSRGDAEAGDRLVTTIYEELRRLAAVCLRHERPQQTLQPTALVHEAYLRLVRQHRIEWRHRGQFFYVAAQMMRRILVDRARARQAAKRAGGWSRVTLDDVHAGWPSRGVDVLDLDRALAELAEFDARKCRVAELRFFAGLSLAETGQALDLSIATVEREWQSARAWLYARLTSGPNRR